MGELECDTEVQIMGEGRAVTGDSGSKAGQGRVFTGEKDERGHGEVGLSYLPIYGLGELVQHCWESLIKMEGSRRLQRGGADKSRPAKLHTKHSASHKLAQAR